MPVSEKTYRKVALEDREGHWELHHGELRRKPEMSYDHNELTTRLFVQLAQQIDWITYNVRANMGTVRRSPQSYYIPDVYVFPTELGQAQRGRRGLETYSVPLPLVVEVWSPSTGDFDVETKFQEYRARGDREIWRIHPYDRTLTAWRRQPDGTYDETVYRSGAVQPVALPNITIDLDTLFE